MKPDHYARTAFELACGDGVRFVRLDATPTGADFSFCIVSIDRVRTIGRFPPRPVAPGGPGEVPREPRHGGRLTRRGDA